MPPTNDVEVYQLRVILRGVNPLIWRRFLTRSDTTVADLHDILQIVYRDGGIGFRDAPDAVTLAALGLRLKERFLYEYDFGDKEAASSNSREIARTVRSPLCCV